MADTGEIRVDNEGYERKEKISNRGMPGVLHGRSRAMGPPVRSRGVSCRRHRKKQPGKQYGVSRQTASAIIRYKKYYK